MNRLRSFAGEMRSGEGQRPNVSRNQLAQAGPRVRRAFREQKEIPESVLGAIDEFRAWHLPPLQDVQSRLSSFFHGEVGIADTDLGQPFAIPPQPFDEEEGEPRT